MRIVDKIRFLGEVFQPQGELGCYGDKVGRQLTEDMLKNMRHRISVQQPIRRAVVPQDIQQQMLDTFGAIYEVQESIEGDSDDPNAPGTCQNHYLKKSVTNGTFQQWPNVSKTIWLHKPCSDGPNCVSDSPLLPKNVKKRRHWRHSDVAQTCKKGLFPNSERAT